MTKFINIKWNLQGIHSGETGTNRRPKRIKVLINKEVLYFKSFFWREAGIIYK